MSRDPALLASTFMANVAFLGMSWKQMLGRPTITLLATQYLLGKLYSGALALLRGTSWYCTLSVHVGLPCAFLEFFAKTYVLCSKCFKIIFILNE